jgi:tetratricopeptide (TPR) repeat protein
MCGCLGVFALLLTAVSGGATPLTPAEEQRVEALSRYAWGYYLALDDAHPAAAAEAQYLAAIEAAPRADVFIRELLLLWAEAYPGRDSELAVRHLQPIALLHPEAIGLNLVVANAYLHLQRADDALTLLESLLAHDGLRDARVVRELVICHSVRGDAAAGHKLLKRAADRGELRGDWAVEQAAALFYSNVAHDRRFDVSDRQRRRYHALSMAHAERAVAARQAADSAKAGVALAEMLHQAGRSASAEAVLETLDAKGLGTPQSWQLLAHCSEATANWPAAARAWQLVSATDPHAWSLHHRAGRCLRRAGDLAAAAAEYGLAFRLNPHPGLARELAHIHLRLGDHKQAMAMARRAPAREVATHVLRSRIQRAGGAPSAARSALIEARRLATAEPDIHLPATFHIEWAAVHIALDQIPEVIAGFEAALALAPDNPMLMNNLGYYLADAGEHLPRAEALIRRALAAKPQSPDYLDSLAWVLYRQQRLAAAEQVIRRAIAAGEGQPDEPSILEHAAAIFAARNQPAQAAEFRRRAAAAEALQEKPVMEGDDEE